MLGGGGGLGHAAAEEAAAAAAAAGAAAAVTSTCTSSTAKKLVWDMSALLTHVPPGSAARHSHKSRFDVRKVYTRGLHYDVTQS